MKRFYMILAVALATSLSVNAQEAKTYDFTGNSTDGAAVEVNWGEEVEVVSTDAAQAKTGGLKAGQTNKLALIASADENYDNRFAGHNRAKSWTFRDTKDGVWKGLWSQYDRGFAILNLNEGDKIAITLSYGSKFDIDDPAKIDEEDPLTLEANETEHQVDPVTGDEADVRKSTTFNLTYYTYDGAADNHLMLWALQSSYIESITITPAGSSTGISQVNAQTRGDNKWYNLQGIEVDQPSHGIFVKNGRKVVVK